MSGRPRVAAANKHIAEQVSNRLDGTKPKLLWSPLPFLFVILLLAL